MQENRRWLMVVIFAAAMAWVEAAVVYYLRVMIDRVIPFQPDPLPVVGGLAVAELLREAATLVMLWAAGWLAGRGARQRFGYSLLAFGVWDILYYVYLRVLTGWPATLLDWDILFLLPLPWWGPVIAPVGIAALMIALGTLLSRERLSVWPAPYAWALGLAGAGLALYVFMADALAQGGSLLAIRSTLPQTFNWPLFAVAYLLLAAPVADALRQRWGPLQRRASSIEYSWPE
jgi:hypothetical protein